MDLSLDHFVNLFQWTIFNPLLAIGYIAFYVSGSQYGQHDHSTYPFLFSGALASLFCWLLSWSAAWWTNRPSLPSLTSSDWSSELVVITGGASGLGAQLALQLAFKGVKVVTVDTQNSSHHSPDPEVLKNIHPYICDVSNATVIAKMAKSIRYLHGDPTILINNAGVVNGLALTQLEPGKISSLVNVNLTAQLWMLREFLPGMIEAVRKGRKGCHVVSLASIMGHVGVSEMVDYCAAKHGVVGMHKALRYELRTYHKCPQIKTTLVVLGHVRTKLFQGIRFNPLAKFLAPSLEPEYVASRIVKAIQKRQAGTIALPWYANWTEAITLLPSWAADLLQCLSGANHSMQDVKKNR